MSQSMFQHISKVIKLYKFSLKSIYSFDYKCVIYIIFYIYLHLTRNVQHFCKFLSKHVGAVDAVVHGDVLDGDEGTDVHRSGPRMLT